MTFMSLKFLRNSTRLLINQEKKRKYFVNHASIPSSLIKK